MKLKLFYVSFYSVDLSGITISINLLDTFHIRSRIYPEKKNSRTHAILMMIITPQFMTYQLWFVIIFINYYGAAADSVVASQGHILGWNWLHINFFLSLFYDRNDIIWCMKLAVGNVNEKLKRVSKWQKGRRWLIELEMWRWLICYLQHAS